MTLNKQHKIHQQETSTQHLPAKNKTKRKKYEHTQYQIGFVRKYSTNKTEIFE